MTEGGEYLSGGMPRIDPEGDVARVKRKAARVEFEKAKADLEVKKWTGGQRAKGGIGGSVKSAVNRIFRR